MSRLSTAVRALRGNRITAAIEELHRSEQHLAAELLRLADRHQVDHEVYHVARDIAGWSTEHVRRLAQVGAAHDLDLDPDPIGHGAIVERVRQQASELTGRLHAPALLLLTDLRHLHRTAAGVSLDWEVLAQSAQALQDTDLLTVAEDCHPETLRQLRWANAKVKEISAQAMVIG